MKLFFTLPSSVMIAWSIRLASWPALDIRWHIPTIGSRCDVRLNVLWPYYQPSARDVPQVASRSSPRHPCGMRRCCFGFWCQAGAVALTIILSALTCFIEDFFRKYLNNERGRPSGCMADFFEPAPQAVPLR